MGVLPRAGTAQDDARTLKGFRRRLSESARDVHGEGFHKLVRLGSGLRRRLSGSTRDLFSSVTSPVGSLDEPKTNPNELRRHLSTSMKDLLLHGVNGGGIGGIEASSTREGTSEGLGRKLSRRLSLLAGNVASRADQTRGSLRTRWPNLRRSRSFSVTVILPDASSRTM
ncbi:hypothetical protein SK128_006731 [Halocaridina rubra]|uniref:Uncharacterized protein n=1 Tax=Halocaridina rubra TaxID=373956 RepID=A0AAN8WPG6_HALRR